MPPLPFACLSLGQLRHQLCHQQIAACACRCAACVHNGCAGYGVSHRQELSGATSKRKAHVQELKLLREMLASSDYSFVLDLAALANRREFLNLEKWLPGIIAADQGNVVSALTMMLDRRVAGEAGAGQLAPVTLKQILSVRARPLCMPLVFSLCPGREKQGGQASRASTACRCS